MDLKTKFILLHAYNTCPSNKSKNVCIAKSTVVNTVEYDEEERRFTFCVLGDCKKFTTYYPWMLILNTPENVAKCSQFHEISKQLKELKQTQNNLIATMDTGGKLLGFLDTPPEQDKEDE